MGAGPPCRKNCRSRNGSPQRKAEDLEQKKQRSIFGRARRVTTTHHHCKTRRTAALSAFIELMRPAPGFKGKMNAQHRRALDPGPWPLKKTPCPVIIGKGRAGKGQDTRPAFSGGRQEPKSLKLLPSVKPWLARRAPNIFIRVLLYAQAARLYCGNQDNSRCSGA
jgi:hypothetical protein